MKDFGRLFTAMITPMDEKGEVNYRQAQKLARRLITAGNDGLVIGGTTGESPALSVDERLGLFAAVKEAVGPNVSIIVGTTDNNHRQSIEMTQQAEKLGIDGILCTVPAYSKPQQEGLYLHFKAIAKATSLPCMLYNVPSRTVLNMNSKTTLKLAEIDNIVGIKEASGDAVQVANIIDQAPDGFRVWSGNDNETFSIICTGGYGVVSVAGHLVGSQIKKLISYINEGKIEKAASEHRRLLPLFDALFWVTSPAPIKYAINRAGFKAGPTRLPLVPLSTDFKRKFDAVIDRYEIDL